MSRRWRALRVTALVAALVVSVSACGGLPGTGPVVEGRPLVDTVNERVRVAASGPVDGQSPEQIVRGFLRAGEDSDESHQLGKAFLAPQSVDLWRWNGQDVVVYGDDLTVRRARTEDAVVVSATVLGRLSPDGHYAEQPQGTRASVRLGVRKVGGEWRIELPREGFGLWLDVGQFDRSYLNQLVYYVTTTGRDLVPDSRWFPNTAPLATTLARAQLAPVPAYLAGAAVSRFPVGTQLAVNAVPIDNGVAQVNLSARALSADPDDRAAMWAQMTQTLQQVSSVGSVSLAVDGTPLELPGGQSSVAGAEELGYETVTRPAQETALLRTGTALYRIPTAYVPDVTAPARRPDTTRRDGDVSTIPDNWAHLALSVDGRQVAAVSGDRTRLSVWRTAADNLFLTPFATGLTRPAFDATGYLWTGGRGSDGVDRVYVLDSVSRDPEARPQPVAVPWLAGRRVTALAVAADAARVLLVTSDRFGRDVQLGLSGIVRSPNGEPVSLAPPQREAQSLVRIEDVTWTGPASFAVLATATPEGAMRPWTGTVGSGIDGRLQSSQRLQTVPGAVTITTVGGPRGLVITTSDQRVLVRVGSTWRQIDKGRNVLVPGGGG